MSQSQSQNRKSEITLSLLRAYESRNITFIEEDGSWPIVWERAQGVDVWDAEGKKYLDLTAAFGVAASGHANPRVVRAGQRQMGRLLHAMGDVHPHALKAQLARELSRLTFEQWGERAEGRGKSVEGKALRPASRITQLAAPKQEAKAGHASLTAKTIFCNSGFEAVEAALKTATLATGKPGVIAFEGAYHGLGYGALNATHRGLFRSPFREQLREFGHFVPFPKAAPELTAHAKRTARGLAGSPGLEALETQLQRLFRRERIGAVLVEPIQVRGGINVPPPGFLPLLRRLCDAHQALLILDEIYTGFGRTGRWFATEHVGVTPDVMCLGKALTGGFPLSACVGRADLMDVAWPPSSGEAIHTSTFLGHPVGCAMALAQIAELRARKLVERSARLGEFLKSALLQLQAPPAALRLNVRGLGLLVGLELQLPEGGPATKLALSALKDLLHRGFIFLPEGEHANVLSFTPPLTISEGQLQRAVNAVQAVLNRAQSG